MGEVDLGILYGFGLALLLFSFFLFLTDLEFTLLSYTGGTVRNGTVGWGPP